MPHGKDEQTGWIVEMLMASASVTPAALLEEVMADERCVAFGPIHHFIVGAVRCLRAGATPKHLGSEIRCSKTMLADLMSPVGLRAGGDACAAGAWRGGCVCGHGICNRARQCAAAQ